jgi:hypothetical protein
MLTHHCLKTATEKIRSGLFPMILAKVSVQRIEFVEEEEMAH